MSFCTQVTDDGRVVVHDSKDGTTPFDLPLSLVLGDLPQKVYTMETAPRVLKPLEIPADVTVPKALDRVLR